MTALQSSSLRLRIDWSTHSHDASPRLKPLLEQGTLTQATKDVHITQLFSSGAFLPHDFSVHLLHRKPLRTILTAALLTEEFVIFVQGKYIS